MSTVINSCEDMERTVQDFGILPFFKNNIPGFSIEEMTPGSLWFSNEVDGPWEWKGPVIREGNCAYGKLFRGKAGYISLDLYPDFLNMRRAGYKMTPKEKEVYQILTANESMLSKELKKSGGFKKTPRLNALRNPLDKLIKTPRARRKDGEGFETIMTRLQMRCYVVIADFEYQYTRDGERYGWGIARYTTPEALFDADSIITCNRTPEESREYLIRSIAEKFPEATDAGLRKLLAC